MPSAKHPDESASNGQGLRGRGPRKRPLTLEGNDAFVLAFADALRDILRDESRPIA